MKILILDPYKKVDYRISKDTSGGYGTGNNFGSSIVPRILKVLLKKRSHWPPLFAAYTFSVLKEKQHDVQYSEVLPNDFSSFDFFIVVSSIVCCETELDKIKILKKNDKKVFVIGPFATNNHKLYSDQGASVIIGEPEFYFKKFDNYKEDLQKKVVAFSHNISLDELPFPNWSEMINNFNGFDKLFGNLKSVPIIATRGCPYSCSEYCVYPLQQGKQIRQRSIKNILDEIEYWQNNHNIRMFIFRDPVFSINRKHTMALCEELIKRNLNIKFAIETHLRILDSELLSLLIKAGLKATIVGVEGADTTLLQNEKRFTVTVDKQEEKIKELQSKKIQVSAMYIIGFPSDNEQSINNTINYAKKLNTTYAQFSIWTPYPGTPVYEKYKEFITKNRYESFDQYTLVYKHEKFNEEEIKKFLEKSYTKFYLNLNWLFNYLKSFYV